MRITHGVHRLGSRNIKLFFSLFCNIRAVGSISFVIDLFKNLASFGSWYSGRSFEKLEHNVDNLAEPVDVENIEWCAGKHTYEHVLELDESPNRRLHAPVEDDPVGQDGDNSDEEEYYGEDDAVDKIESRALFVECE